MLSQLEAEQRISVGKSEARIDAVEKVTGRAAYCFDLSIPNMLYAAVKRSAHDHAKILSIDTSKAERLTDVKAVIAARDLPERYVGTALKDTPVLARDIVRYVGEPVAAVAAETLRTAIEAVERMEVEYEPLQPILDPELSASENPPVVLHPRLAQYQRSPSGTYFASYDPNHPNVNNALALVTGDVDAGFSNADLIIENRFETGMAQHFPMEPMVILVKPESDGMVTVWISGQNAHRARHEICDGLGIDENRVRVIVPKHVGGGFGNRYGSSGGAITVALAMKANRPVKLVFTRQETFMATTVRHPSVFNVKDGVTRDGKILARQIKAIYDGGAYSFEGHNTVKNCAAACSCIYNVPNLKLEVYRVYTNKQPGGAYRGYGGPQAIWAMERQIDIVARRLNIDPVELRRRNMLKDEGYNALGEQVENLVVDECLRRVGEAIAWNHVDKGNDAIWRRGKGVAVAAKWSWPNYPNIAYVKILDDGSVELICSCIDVGQGTPTALAQIVAEEFKLPLNKVRVSEADSITTPVNVGAAGSRQLYNLGNAVLRACFDAKLKLFKVASKVIGEDPGNLTVEDGVIYSVASRDKKIHVKGLFKLNPGGGTYVEEEGEIVGKGFWVQKEGFLDPRTGRAVGGRATAYYTSTAQGAEVAVNIKTGEVKILGMAAAVNVGKAINPRLVEGQIEGGVAMALGPTLYEEAVVKEGGFINPDLKDYKLPSSLDVPEIKPIILEYPSQHGPYGAEGCGEAALLAVAPAVGNAIADALGIELNVIPMTRERILRAIRGVSA